jgi:nitrogenase-associated protein
MVQVVFYEKPGCINNTRQKKLLHAAGHEVIAKNLLEEPWQAETLRRYFGELPVAEWFNRTAPAVKSGEVDPDAASAQEALALMVAMPLLIRRPLMQVAGECRVGFDMAAVDAWIGLAGAGVATDVETCPRDTGTSCEPRDG